MRKICYLLLLIFLTHSCDNSKKTSDHVEISAQEILNNSLKKYNTKAFYNSTIKFDLKDLHYNIYRSNNIANFEVTRLHNSVLYKATYENGYTRYFIDGEEQTETSTSRQFIGVKLEGLIYLFSLPHVLNQNAVILNKLEDVTIRKQQYYAVHVSFTKVEDAPENEFILYINPETHLIDYFAENYDLTAGDRLTFHVAYNTRTINKLIFSDYHVLTPWRQKKATDPKPDTKLADLYKSYNNFDLEELEPLIFKNITVDLH